MRKVIGMIGASNAVGRGLPLSPPPAYANAQWPDGSPRIWAMPIAVDAAVNPTFPSCLPNPARPFVQAADPLWPGKDVGFGIALADKLVELQGPAIPDLEVGLVNCAVGGVGSAYWKSNGLNTWPMAQAWSRLHAAKQWGELIAVVMYQEADALLADVTGYPEAVHAIMRDTRAELNLPELLFLPIVPPALPSGVPPATWPSWATIQSWIKLRMAGVSPNVVAVDAAGLTTIAPNDVHLNAASQVTLGHRIAQTIADARPSI